MFYNVLCKQWTISCRFDQCQYSVTAMTPHQQVLESIVGGGVVQVVHQSLDSRSVWLGAAQLLNGQAHVLVGAGATADMARGAGRDKQTLATNHLLLGQGGGLALVIHLKSARYDGGQQKHVKIQAKTWQQRLQKAVSVMTSHSARTMREVSETVIFIPHLPGEGC